jgi:hypothetical protein
MFEYIPVKHGCFIPSSLLYIQCATHLNSTLTSKKTIFTMEMLKSAMPLTKLKSNALTAWSNEWINGGLVN